MKKIILLSFLIGIAKFVFADTIPEAFICRDSVLLFCVHNDQVVTITKNKEQHYLLSVVDKIDTLQIDIPPETSFRNVTAYYNKENCIYFTFLNIYGRGIYNLYKLNLDTKKVITISTLGDYFCIIDNTLVRGCDYECGSLIFSDLDNMHIADTIGLGDFYAFYLRAADKILIEYYESGSVYGFGYYDWNNRKYIEKLPVLDTMQFEIFIDEKGKKYRKNSIDDIDYIYTDITGKYSNLGLVWVDKDFNIIQKTLQSNKESESSFNIGIDNPYYYRYSYIKGRKGNNYVWIACKFSLQFDKALYDIYYNTLLDKSTIENFDEWELHKLKNMIFAKHGYQFQSEYLQAFYNLFDFYKGKLADVSHLLTLEDKKNLELIEQVSKKK
jgi:hypothetical protein